MRVEFRGIVKEVKCKALASLDKGWEVKLQSEDMGISRMVEAPADKEVKVTVEWDG